MYECLLKYQKIVQLLSHACLEVLLGCRGYILQSFANPKVQIELSHFVLVYAQIIEVQTV